MSHFITNDMAHRIAEAQKVVINQAIYRASVEWNYIIVEFKNQLHAQFENILKDPFNTFIKIPVKDNCNEKNFIMKLNDLYSKEFQHSLQIVEDHYYILLQSPHFSSPDNRPKPVLKISSEEIEPEKSYLFSESEKKAFNQREEIERTPRLGYEGELRSGSAEKKNLVTSLLLQRRNSRMSLPVISARGNQEFSTVENSIN